MTTRPDDLATTSQSPSTSAQEFAVRWRRDESYAAGYAKGAAVAAELCATFAYIDESARVMLARDDGEPCDGAKAANVRLLRALRHRCECVDGEDAHALADAMPVIEKLAGQAGIGMEWWRSQNGSGDDAERAATIGTDRTVLDASKLSF